MDFPAEGMEPGALPSPVDPEVERQRLASKLVGIAGRLETEANKRVGLRGPLEREWIEDLQQYNGRYDDDTEKRLNKDASKSKLFLNMTRNKTDAMSARLMDLLFPTDDKNWGIQPTPVPRLTMAAEEAEKAAFSLKQQLEQAGEGEQSDPQMTALQHKADEANKLAAQLQEQIEEGRRRCELMAAEIDDQLKESRYHAVKRDQIEDACKYGTGVTKGPVTGDKLRKGWQQAMMKDEAGNPVLDPNGQPQPVPGEYELAMSDGDRPAMRHVDLWSFFPDMDARTIDEGEGVFERHLMNKKKLRGLAQLKGFDKAAIRFLLTQKPRGTTPSYLATIRSIGSEVSHVATDTYHVWEYTGPLSVEDMQDLATAFRDEDTVQELAQVDPLTEVNAVVWFCDGQVLKFSIYPYDSGECMYSVFSLVKDESSVFGVGIPALMRDPQRSLNAAWRAMMDNAGLASGPQIVIAKGMVEPADGEYTLVPRKVWYAKEGLPKENRAFDTFDIPMHQVELANIVTLSKQFIDDMTSMPQIAQGEQGTGVTKTAQGMALLMNSTNVVFRRIVKNFDDDVTTPDIRRLYDWNMQFNPKPSIKGDYEVDARGSSVLLVREMQAQTLMTVATQLGGHPVYGPMLRNREVLRKLFQALMIPAADVVLTDNEIDAVLAAASAQDEMAKKQQDMAEQQLEAQIQIANMENGTKRYVADKQRETALITMAGRLNMGVDQIEAKLEALDKQLSSKERTFAAEAALEQRNAAEARAAGVQPSGSGGYFSAGGKPATVQKPVQ